MESIHIGNSPSLSSSHSVLLLLSELGGRRLLGLLDLDDLVTHGIELVLLVLLLEVDSGTGSLTLGPVLTRGDELSILHGPDFSADLLDERVRRVSMCKETKSTNGTYRLRELSVMRDTQDTTLKVLQGLDQGGEGLSVQVVGRLIQTDDVGLSPGSGTQDDLDLLTSRETSHGVVGDELGLETEIGKVLLNLLSDKGPHHTESLSLSRVELHDLLFESSEEQLVSRHPNVLGRRETLERDLVLVRLLELLSSDKLLDDSLDTLDDDDSTLLHLLLLFGGQLTRGLLEFLQILTSLVSPQHVVERGLVEVVIDVVESVLGNVTNDQVGVLPNLTTVLTGGLGLTGQQLDQGGLTRSVGTENGDSGRQRDHQGDVVQDLVGRVGVGVVDLSHLQQRLFLGLDSVQKRRDGQLELVVVGGGELVVRLCLGDHLDESLEVTGVSLDLESVQVDNVGTGSVEEVTVVRDDDRGTVGERGEVVDQPSDVDDVQMVGRLVQQQDVGLEQDGTGQSQLHLPSTGQGTDRDLLLDVVKPDVPQGGLDVLGRSQQSLVGEHPVDDRDISLGTIDIVLNVESSNDRRVGETLDLVVDNGVHQGGLSGTVSSTESVSVTTLQSQGGHVQQDLGTVGQGKGTVAQILTLLLVLEHSVVLTLLVGLFLQQLSDDGRRVVVGNGQGQVRDQGGLPSGLVVIVSVDESSGENTGVDERVVLVVRDGLGISLSQLGDQVGDQVVTLGDLERRNIGTVTLVNLGNLSQGLDGTVDDTTSLGVGHDLGGLEQTGQELGNKRPDGVLVVDQLGHVVGNDGDLSLDGGGTLVETTNQQGGHQRERRGVDLGNKGGSGQQGDGLGNLLDRVDEGLDEGRDELFDILVGNQRGRLGQGRLGSLLDVRLGIPNGIGEDRDHHRHGLSGLQGGGEDELINDGQRPSLDLPFPSRLNLVQESRQEDGSRPRVHRLDKRLGSRQRSGSDRRGLVSKRLQESGEDGTRLRGDDVTLELLSRAILTQGGDGLGSTFTSLGLLLVAKGLRCTNTNTIRTSANRSPPPQTTPPPALELTLTSAAVKPISSNHEIDSFFD